MEVAVSSLSTNYMAEAQLGQIFASYEPDGIVYRVVINGGGLLNAPFALRLNGDRPFVAHRLDRSKFGGVPLSTPNLRFRFSEPLAPAQRRYEVGTLIVDARGCHLVVQWAGGAMGDSDTALLHLQTWSFLENFRLEDPALHVGRWQLVCGTEVNSSVLASFEEGVG